ncbi:MAG: hypothetical protein KTR15_09995 [Phycisphaeraceae bacterium]|nr:hypothetical protein [Phycisphaeraceae bacterium]
MPPAKSIKPPYPPRKTPATIANVVTVPSIAPVDEALEIVVVSIPQPSREGSRRVLGLQRRELLIRIEAGA